MEAKNNIKRNALARVVCQNAAVGVAYYPPRDINAATEVAYYQGRGIMPPTLGTMPKASKLVVVCLGLTILVPKYKVLYILLF